jgi:hypothetical protein
MIVERGGEEVITKVGVSSTVGMKSIQRKYVRRSQPRINRNWKIMIECGRGGSRLRIPTGTVRSLPPRRTRRATRKITFDISTVSTSLTYYVILGVYARVSIPILIKQLFPRTAKVLHTVLFRCARSKLQYDYNNN